MKLTALFVDPISAFFLRFPRTWRHHTEYNTIAPLALSFLRAHTQQLGGSSNTQSRHTKQYYLDFESKNINFMGKKK